MFDWLLNWLLRRRFRCDGGLLAMANGRVQMSIGMTGVDGVHLLSGDEVPNYPIALAVTVEPIPEHGFVERGLYNTHRYIGELDSEAKHA
jgi:hypothetical protein